MTIATLCTTSGAEPWAANVPFEVKGNNWVTTLKTKYSHFQNLKTNPNAVIVFKQRELELIMKAKASLGPVSNDEAEVKLSVEWLRIVDGDGASDINDAHSIAVRINRLQVILELRLDQ